MENTMEVSLNFEKKGRTLGDWFDVDKKKSYIYLIYTLKPDAKNLDKLIYIGETCDEEGYDKRVMKHFDDSEDDGKDPLYKYCKKNNIDKYDLVHKIAYVDSKQMEAVEAALIFANRHSSQGFELQNDKYKDDDSELTKDNKDITKITISGYCYPFKTMSDKTKGGKKIDIIVK